MKKNIIILLVTSIIFVLSLIFFVYVNQLGTEDSNIQKEVVEKIEELEENIVEEESKTENIENVNYKDFTIYNEDGGEIKFSNYKDMPAMLLFFNSENIDSIDVLKKVENMYKNYEEKINFFMINTAKEVDENLKNEYTINIYYDFYEEAAKNYNITEVPSMIYINETNEVFNAKVGITTTDALEANLDILSNNF